MSDRDSHAGPAFDERRALDDLETLHREILRARVQRERAQAEFDEFVRGFHAGEEVGEKAGKRTVPFVPEAIPAAPHTDVVPPGRRARRSTRIASSLLIGAAALIAVALGSRAWRAPGTASAPTPPSKAPAASVSAPPPGVSRPSATPAAPSPSAPSTSGVSLELVTRRPVWMRVTVDGRRAFEREVAAGQRIPVRGERSIVIRAGDAGAVAVAIDGRDAGPLGRDGAIATRAFNASPR